MSAELDVTLVAYTQFDWETAHDLVNWLSDSHDGEALIEFAGRACYQSWGKPNPKTATNEGYIANIIKKRHMSVLEHASATFYVTGVSRSLTHELIRHRHLSFSELSQRYVDIEDDAFVEPPALATQFDLDHLDDIFGAAWDWYQGYAADLPEDRGLSRKEAREAARAVLPAMTETKIVVTGNFRAWWDFLEKRLSKHADKEMQRFAQEVFVQLLNLAPNVFDNFPDYELSL